MSDSDQGSSGPLFTACSSTCCENAAFKTPFESETLDSHGLVNADTAGFAPFDLVLQKQRFATMMDFLPELLQLFCVNAGEHLDTLRTALSRGEFSEAANAAHTLKGMSSVVCATAVQEMSGQLEAILKSGDHSNALVILEELETQLTRAIASLNASLAP
jgi:HPt (histidine-containing phosphotransfer) domain-containing protein